MFTNIDVLFVFIFFLLFVFYSGKYSAKSMLNIKHISYNTNKQLKNIILVCLAVYFAWYI